MAKGQRTLGFTGHKHSVQTRIRMREAHLGKKMQAHSDETKQKISVALKGRIPVLGMLGKKHSERTRQKMSDHRRGRPKSDAWRARMRGENNYFWANPQHNPGFGRRVYYAGICFRSSFEARLARAFTVCKIHWVYESKRFDLGFCTYLPDFFLPDEKVYWEVKGWFDLKSQQKIRLFRERYPDIPLVVADLSVIKMMEQIAIQKGG